MSEIRHWGEMVTSTTLTTVPDVSEDIEISMKKCFLAEFDSDDSSDSQMDEVVSHSHTVDPHILYAINLHKHINTVWDMIEETAQISEINVLLVSPLIPEMPKMTRKHERNCLNFLPMDSTPFVEGIAVEHPEINREVAKEVLSKCVAAMCAQIGFTTTSESTLQVLTDAVELFMEKICKRFKSASEEEHVFGLGGFPSFPEKVLIEFGMGGMVGLHDYYQNRVLKYINVLYERCKKINKSYETALVVGINPENLECKKELVDDDINQVHFPETEGVVEHFSLVSGYELLNTLEAVTQEEYE